MTRPDPSTEPNYELKMSTFSNLLSDSNQSKYSGALFLSIANGFYYENLLKTHNISHSICTRYDVYWRRFFSLAAYGVTSRAQSRRTRTHFLPQNVE